MPTDRNVRVNRFGSIDISGGMGGTFGSAAPPASAPRTNTMSGTRGIGMSPGGVGSSALDNSMWDGLTEVVDLLDARAAEGNTAATDEAIDMISRQISEIVDDAPARASGRRTRGGTPRRYETRLPSGPTPYELWQSKHGDTGELSSLQQAASKKLSPEEEEALLERLSTMKSQFTRQQLQVEKLKEELSGQSFTPKINEKSRELTEMYPNLIHRYEADLEHRKKVLKTMEYKVEVERLKDTTFEPDLEKTRKVNDRLLATRDRALRIEDRCIQYGEEQALRASQRREVVQQYEDQLLTFKPDLSSTTKYRSRVGNRSDALRAKRGALKESLRSGMKMKPGDAQWRSLPGHDEETFKPVIQSKHSRAVKRSGKAHERLYRTAVQNRRARDQRANSNLQNSYRSPARGSRGARSPRAPDTPTMSNQTLNIVTWEAPKHNFLFQMFS